MTKTFSLGLSLLTTVLVTAPAMAQEEVKVSAGADVVSNYVWRGQQLGGVAVQPSLGIAYKGLSLGAWGNVGLDGSNTNELDFTLGYNICGFRAAITDYFCQPTNQPNYFDYAAHTTTHVFEATLGYDFGPVALSLNTNFAGRDYKANGKRAYSSYFEVSAPFTLGGVDFSAAIGGTPAEGAYASEAAITNISLKANKEILGLPAFVQIGASPSAETTYFVIGLSF